MSTALTVQTEAPSSSLDIYFDEAKFNQAMRVARVISESSLVPEHFRGPDNIANCLLALQFCARLREDPFMAMQKLYVVHGRLGMESQLAIALVNRSRTFRSDIAWEPNGKTGDKFGYFAIGVKANSGAECREECTIEMAKTKGWWGKSGSNWPSMTDQMLKYRSAMILCRLHCPEILMGMYTVDELKDVGEAEVITRTSAADLNAALSDDTPAKEATIVSSPQQKAETVKTFVESRTMTMEELQPQPEKAPETASNGEIRPTKQELLDWAKTLSAAEKKKYREIATSYSQSMGELEAAQRAYADMKAVPA